MRAETAKATRPWQILGYAFAAAAVAVVVALKRMLSPAIGHDAPFLLMLLPVLAATWYGGAGPGAFAGALTCLSTLLLFLRSDDGAGLTPPAILQTIAFAVQSGVAVGLVTRLWGARSRARVAAARVARIHAVAMELGRVRTLEEVTRVILSEAVEALEANASAVFLVPAASGPLRLVALLHDRHRATALPLDISLDEDFPVARAARAGEAVFVESHEELDERFPCTQPRVRAHMPPSMMCLPMIVHGRVVGILGLGFDRKRRFGAEERFWAQTLAQDCGMAIERARLFEAERRARIDAEEASRAKDGFLGIASHELRAPLTAILGWTSLLKATPPNDQSRMARGLDVIERSAKAQARLVDDLLDASRIAAGKRMVHPKPMRLAPLVRVCLESVRACAESRRVDVAMGRDLDVVVHGDADRLRQVIDNLLSNALKFTPAGGHVQVDLTLAADRCVLRVHDDGQGIPAAEIDRVFEAFHQVDSSTTRREGGLGLGLAIVRHIVREHGGTTRIDSPGIGLGTTVTVELPVLEVPPELVTAATASSGAPAAMLGGLRILVVDDDDDARDAVAEMLTSHGAQVESAPSASEALLALNAFSPNAIVSDIRMPGEDGLWLIRKVRALDTDIATVPAVALTGRTCPEDVRAVRAAGYQEHLAKPPESERLASLVAHLCAHSIGDAADARRRSLTSP